MYRLIIAGFITSVAFAGAALASDTKGNDIIKQTRNAIEETRVLQETHAAAFGSEIEVLFDLYRTKMKNHKEVQQKVRNLMANYFADQQAFSDRINVVDRTASGVIELLGSGQNYFPNEKWLRFKTELTGDTRPYELMYGNIYKNKQKVVIALQTMDAYMVEIIVFYHKYTRPALLNNIKTRYNGGAITPNISSLAVMGGNSLKNFIDKVAKRVPEILDSKTVIAALKMEAEAKVFYEAHQRYIAELDAEAADASRKKNNGLFKEGNDIDYNEISISTE